jgi:membrane-bound serine protease (ClpP class)
MQRVSLVDEVRLKARRRPVVSGAEEMIGSVGEVIDDFDGTGWVRVHSENWKASSRSPLQRGQKVTVTEMDGLELSVTAASETKHEGG